MSSLWYDALVQRCNRFVMQANLNLATGLPVNDWGRQSIQSGRLHRGRRYVTRVAGSRGQLPPQPFVIIASSGRFSTYMDQFVLLLRAAPNGTRTWSASSADAGWVIEQVSLPVQFDVELGEVTTDLVIPGPPTRVQLRVIEYVPPTVAALRAG